MSLFERLCECLKKKKRGESAADELSSEQDAGSERADAIGGLAHDQHATITTPGSDAPPPRRRRKPTPYPAMISRAMRRRKERAADAASAANAASAAGE
jgi:hypothetical protein